MAPSDSHDTRGQVRVWTLTKEGRVATCDAVAHLLGVELVSAVDGDVRRTEVVRSPKAGQTLAEQWRKVFEAKGWSA